MSQVNDKFTVYVCSGGRFEYINNNPIYLPVDCNRGILRLPVAPQKPISYKSLIKSVLRASELPLDSDIRLKYMVYQLLIDINDYVDSLEEFWLYAINNAPIQIYVVENTRYSSGRGSNQPSTSGSGGFQEHFQHLQTNEQYPPPSTRPISINTQQYQPQYYQPPYQPPYPSPYQQYPHQNIFKEVTKHTQETFQPTHGFDHVEDADVEHYRSQNVNPEKTFDHPFDNDIISDEETNKEKDDSEERSKKREDMFWNMPPLLQEGLPDSTKCPVTMYEQSSRVKVGQVFESKEELKLQLETKCLEEGFTTKIKHSDKIRYVVKCALTNCDWQITARRILHTENFQVRKFVDVHTCSRSQLQANNRHANKRVLGHILKELMTKEGRVYRGNDIQVDMSARFGVSLSYKQAWIAKCYAIELLRGTPQHSFQMLPLYFHNLKLRNPQSVTNVRTDEEGRFVMCYMSIGAAVSNYKIQFTHTYFALQLI